MSAVAQQSVTRAPEQTGIALARMPVEKAVTRLAVKPAQARSGAESRARAATSAPIGVGGTQAVRLRQRGGHSSGRNASMIEGAAVVAAVLGHWDDSAISAALLFLNAPLE